MKVCRFVYIYMHTFNTHAQVQLLCVHVVGAIVSDSAVNRLYLVVQTIGATNNAEAQLL